MADELDELFGDDFGEEFGDEDADDLDGVLVGIPVTSVAEGATETVNIPITKRFRAQRLILGEAARAAGVFVTQISVSSEQQVISPGPVPGEVFVADATHRLRGTIATPGVGIDITFQNTTSGSVDVSGAIFGPSEY